MLKRLMTVIIILCVIQTSLNYEKQLLSSNGSMPEYISCLSSTETPSTSSMKITKKHTMLKVGDTEQLVVRFSPDKEVNDLTWSSAAENIAKVDSNGKVTGTAIGKTVVTAISKEENLKASIEVEVAEGISYKIFNPYSRVNWNKVNQIKSNLHAHTTNSDGRDTIQEVLDKHAELGYGALAITDHDHLTFPWKDADGEDIVIPRGLNLIPGNEYSKNIHHINGFFIKDIDIFTSEEEALRHIEEQGGISHFNHPGRYDKDVVWYVDLYTKFKSLVGLEVINKADRYPNDRKLWDDILTEIIDRRPVFGFANADSHRLHEIDTSYNIVLLDGNYSSEKFKKALSNGEFYFTARISKENNRTSNEDVTPPTITGIYVDNKNGTITIKGENIETIDWIGNNSRNVGSGETLILSDAVSPTPYVRAVIKGKGGVSFTQPFKITANRSRLGLLKTEGMPQNRE
jgi:hypothetical protein